ncbi:MAG: hypothetical protein KBA75_05630 [Alphaproteobacteria bacterium]|nr:hypothetical protein [Alphaproteobacteria bacterium]
MQINPNPQSGLLRRLRLSGVGHVVIIMLALSLLLRSMMPAGFMPDISKAANFPLKICSSYGSKTILVPLADFFAQAGKTGKPISSDDAVHKQHDCVLCAAPVQGTGNDNANLLHAVLFYSIVLSFIAWVGATRHRYEAATAPRGPPSFS